MSYQIGSCSGIRISAGEPDYAMCYGNNFFTEDCDLCCPQYAFSASYYAEKMGIASLHYRIERHIAGRLGRVILTSHSGDANGLVTLAYLGGALDPVQASGSWAFRLAQALHNFGVLFPGSAWASGRVDLVKEFTLSTLVCRHKSYHLIGGSHDWPSGKRTAEQSEILKRILPRSSLSGGILPSDDYLKKWRAEVVVPLVLSMLGPGEFMQALDDKYITMEAFFKVLPDGVIEPSPWMVKFLDVFAPINISGAVKAYVKAKQAGTHIGAKAAGNTVAKAAGNTVAKAAGNTVAEPKSDSKTSKAGIATVGILAAVAVAVAAFSFKGQA